MKLRNERSTSRPSLIGQQNFGGCAIFFVSTWLPSCVRSCARARAKSSRLTGQRSNACYRYVFCRLIKEWQPVTGRRRTAPWKIFTTSCGYAHAGRSRAFLVGYYERLASVFGISDNHLLHALALYQLYQVHRGTEAEKVTSDSSLDVRDMQGVRDLDSSTRTAVRLVLATLCVPPVELSGQGSIMEVFADAATLSSIEQARQNKMLALLDWSNANSPGAAMKWNRMVSHPSRAWLIEQIILSDADELCPAALRNLLYEFVEPSLLHWRRPGKALARTPWSLASTVQQWLKATCDLVGNEAPLLDVKPAISGDGGSLMDGAETPPVSASTPGQSPGNLDSYLMPLSRAVIAELLLRIAQHYETFLLSELRAMMSFLPPEQTQLIALEYIRAGLVPFRLDFRDGVLRYVRPVIEQDDLGDVLARLATRLHLAATIIAERTPVADENEVHVLNVKGSALPFEHLESEQTRRLTQLEGMNAFLKKLDELALQIEQDEKRQAQLEAARLAEEEKRRIAEETRRRELEMIRKEMEEKEQAELRRLKAEMEARKRAGLSATVAAAGLSLPPMGGGMTTPSATSAAGVVTPGMENVAGMTPAGSAWGRGGLSASALLSGAGSALAPPGATGDLALGAGLETAGHVAVGADAMDSEGDRLSRQELLLQQQQERITQRKALEQKVLNLARRMDYMDRALHEKQASHLEQVHADMVRELIEQRRAAAERRLSQLREQCENDLANRSRLSAVFTNPHYQRALEQVRQEAIARANAEWEQRQRPSAPKQKERDAAADKDTPDMGEASAIAAPARDAKANGATADVPKTADAEPEQAQPAMVPPTKKTTPPATVSLASAVETGRCRRRFEYSTDQERTRGPNFRFDRNVKEH
ncbi:eukaryotic translation initiation factor 3 subunit A [Cyanidiococcus yangmingshanensis]|uniref:Eukaryotic translation initiation factor 3 subunit A n=1 Tax=Cyanidiococcus yangmingshanensis TaxID=2690220 RepID=A0A7J7IFI2_9RHOD|nr:eukaryotic translation initiation factor 3 subunit A [Cyanidiococcus yangmingshanensis]